MHCNTANTDLFFTKRHTATPRIFSACHLSLATIRVGETLWKSSKIAVKYMHWRCFKSDEKGAFKTKRGFISTIRTTYISTYYMLFHFGHAMFSSNFWTTFGSTYVFFRQCWIQFLDRLVADRCTSCIWAVP